MGLGDIRFPTYGIPPGRCHKSDHRRGQTPPLWKCTAAGAWSPVRQLPGGMPHVETQITHEPITTGILRSVIRIGHVCNTSSHT